MAENQDRPVVGHNGAGWWWKDLPTESLTHAKDALSRGLFTTASRTKELEEDFSLRLGFRTSTVCNSGTSALIMALLAHGINSEAEVIVPALTWVASAQAPAILGARVVVADVDRATYSLSAETLERAITPATKAVILVFFNGHRPNLDGIREVASQTGIAIVEDRCKAMGTTFRENLTGESSRSGIAAFSLGMISPVSIGYGGVLSSMHPEDGEVFRRIRDHGMDRNPDVYRQLSQNFKVSDVLASLAPAQLWRLEDCIETAIDQETTYAEELRNSPYGSVVRHVGHEVGTYVMFLAESQQAADAILSQSARRRVPLARYHPPLTQAHYLGGFDSCPASVDLSNRLIHLPCGPNMAEPLIGDAIALLA